MSIQKNKNSEVKLDKEFNLSDDFPVHSYEEWKVSAEKLLKGQSFEKKLVTKTYEGIDLNPIYTKKDIEGLSCINSEPGKDDFLRGSKIDGYLNKGWEICQEIKADSLIDYNNKLKEALKRGQTAVSLDLDLFDMKDQKNFSKVLKDIDITKNPLYIKTGFSSNKVLNLILGHAGEKGNNINEINGVLGVDPIGYLSEHGNLPKTLNDIYQEMESSIRLANEKLPELKVIGINGSLFHNAGADSVTELAASLSIAVEYLSEMTLRGIDINDVAKQISFTLGIGTNFFMEIGKLRAIRVLWQKIIKEFGGNEEARKTHIHAETSLYYQTKLDPFVNTLRTTTEAFSAILGGADVITTTPYDDVSGMNSDLSIRIARNTQIILKKESNLKRLIDPAGGSYYIESLTNEIIKKVWTEFQSIEKNGGILESLKTDYIQDKIGEVISLREKDIFKRKSVIVGTNMFVNAEDKIQDIEKKKSVKVDLEEGELTVRKLNISRIAEPFEEMRKAVSDYSAKTKQKPKVFLANFGEVKQYKGRADFSRGYFEVGGFEIIYPDGFTDIDEMSSAAVKSNAKIIVLCSDDKTYPEIVENFTQSLKQHKADVSVILAGFPGKDEERYRKWGVDYFIFMGSNLFSILESLVKKTGVK